jgi:hypothetical protein
MANADPVAPSVVCTRHGHIIMYLVPVSTIGQRLWGQILTRVDPASIREYVQHSVADLNDNHKP